MYLFHANKVKRLISQREVFSPPPSLSLCRYRPNVRVEYISQELGFRTQEDCLAFLASVGAVLDSTGTLLDCKLTSGKIV